MSSGSSLIIIESYMLYSSCTPKPTKWTRLPVPIGELGNLDLRKFLLVECGIHDIFAYRIQNPGFWNPEYNSRNRDPANDWNLESKFHWQRSWNLESTTWDSGSKTIFDCFTWGKNHYAIKSDNRSFITVYCSWSTLWWMGLCSSSTQWPPINLFLLLCDQEILAFGSPCTGYPGFHRFRAVDPLQVLFLKHSLLKLLNKHRALIKMWGVGISPA